MLQVLSTAPCGNETKVPLPLRYTKVRSFITDQDPPRHSLQVTEDARLWASKKDVNLQDSFKKQKSHQLALVLPFLKEELY